MAQGVEQVQNSYFKPQSHQKNKKEEGEEEEREKTQSYLRP
jgi:hypothetical protein